MTTMEERADRYIDNNFTRIAEEMPICEGMKTLYIESATEQQKIDAKQFSLAFCDAICGMEKRGVCDMRRVTCAKLAKFLNDGMKEE